jgi:hypothetical protein
MAYQHPRMLNFTEDPSFLSNQAFISKHYGTTEFRLWHSRNFKGKRCFAYICITFKPQLKPFQKDSSFSIKLQIIYLSKRCHSKLVLEGIRTSILDFLYLKMFLNGIYSTFTLKKPI